MERDFLEWINKTYRMQVGGYMLIFQNGNENTADGGKISVYRVVNVIRVDIKRPGNKEGMTMEYLLTMFGTLNNLNGVHSRRTRGTEPPQGLEDDGRQQ